MKEKKSVDLIIGASWLIPVEPAGEVLEDHSVAISNGILVDIGTPQELDTQFIPKNKVFLDGHALVPGFVNAHTHVAMTLFRGLADDLPLHHWLTKYIWPLEAQFVGEDFVRVGTKLAIAEMLRGGTTCFNDMYFFPNSVGDVARRTGIRAVLGLIVIDMPTAWAKDTQSYFARGLEVHETFRHNPLITTALAPHSPYTASESTLKQIKKLSDQLDLPVHIHVHETQKEVEEALHKTGERPLTLLHRLGLVNKRLIAVHATQLLSEEIDMLAGKGASVVHCPESNLKLASGVCPVPQLIKAGVTLALGTDGAASNNDLDMLGEMRAAAFLGKLKTQSAVANSAIEMLHIATLGGAFVLGLEKQIGSIKPGKSADIVAIDLRGPDTQPVYHPISQIVYAITRHHVRHVWIAGHHVLENGNLKTIDVKEAVHEAKIFQRMISKKISCKL